MHIRALTSSLDPSPTTTIFGCNLGWNVPCHLIISLGPVLSISSNAEDDLLAGFFMIRPARTQNKMEATTVANKSVVALSCARCQQRKTKCDKADPCSACRRRGSPCIPVRRARLPRVCTGPASEGDVRQRIVRLEHLLRKLKPTRPLNEIDYKPQRGHVDVANEDSELDSPGADERLQAAMGDTDEQATRPHLWAAVDLEVSRHSAEVLRKQLINTAGPWHPRDSREHTGRKAQCHFSC